MKSNYKTIGELVERIDQRNTDGSVTNLIGVSIDKKFISSVANVIGTDLTKYKIIEKCDFAVSLMQVSRDEKIPVACQKEFDKAIMSPAYPIFRVKDTSVILPEYLEMWFMRPEFDREASFIAVGGVRGSMPWDDFAKMKLPVPPIEEQNVIVNSNKVIADRILLKKKINDNLEAQRDAIFTDVYPFTKDGTLPDDWHYKILGEMDCLITDYVANGSFQSLADNVEYLEYDTGNILIRLTDYNNNFSGKFVFVSDAAYDFLSKSKLDGGEIIIANVGVNVGTTFRCPQLPYRMSLAPNTIMLRDDNYQEYLYAYFKSSYGQRALQELVTGSAQPKFNKTSLRKLRIAFPNNSKKLHDISKAVKAMYAIQCQNDAEIRQLLEVQKVLLQELSR